MAGGNQGCGADWADSQDRTRREVAMKRTTAFVLAIFGLVVLVAIVIYLNRSGVLPGPIC